MCSQLERNFILQTFKSNKRHDGRKNEEFRQAKIIFGSEFGSVLVTLGQTKVLAQVSCDLGEPKATRPNEGIMFINVELGQMAAPPNLDINRSSDLNVQISRTLERTFKESRCVDLESLCVKAEENVWVLRIDLSPLNHDGNLIDCCSIAALSALAHFRRPDVSVVEDEIHIHTAAEKELIPMLLHHYPICVSYATVCEGNLAVADPTFSEERVAESQMIFGLNSFRELCCLNLGGSTLTTPEMIVKCASQGAKRAKFLVEHIKSEVEKDFQRREAGERISFATGIDQGLIHGKAEDNFSLRLRKFQLEKVVGVRKKEKVDWEDETEQEYTENGNSVPENTLNNWLPAEEVESDGVDDLSGDSSDGGTLKGD